MEDRITAVIERAMREVDKPLPVSPSIRKIVPPKPVFKNNEQPVKVNTKRLFVIATQDYSGLGWAKKLLEEGEQVIVATEPGDDEDDLKLYEQNGKGFVPKMSMDDAMKKLKSPQTYWIFSENHLTEQAEQLRKQGQKVFGTSTLGERMEHDRAYAGKVAQQSGLDSPDTHGFKSVKEGISFLESHPDTAYVFKPDDAVSSHLTTVPFRERAADANRELFHYLSHLKEEPGSFILQERKYGVEVNVEAWVFEGKPFFAFATLENKRKGIRNSGEMIGCAGDIVWPLDMESGLFKTTIGKMLPFYEKEKYTGFADINVIIGDNKTWFLEVGNRFGYNSHPNIFLSLALDGFGSIMADFMDGKVKGIPEKFRKGFGASIGLGIDSPRPGLPLHLSEHNAKRFYPYDLYKDGEDLLLSGYSKDVGIFCDFDYTLEGAAEIAFHKLFYQEAVSFLDMLYRDDLGSKDYTGAPIKRYEALQAMGLL